MAGIARDKVIMASSLKFAARHPLHQKDTAIKSGFVSINVVATDMVIGINVVITKSGSG